MDLGGPKEAQVQSLSPGGANVPLWEGTYHLANTIVPSVFGGDVALCQSTLTTPLAIIIIRLHCRTVYMQPIVTE